MQVLQGEPRGQVDNASSAHDPVLSLSLSLSLTLSLLLLSRRVARFRSRSRADLRARACVLARAFPSGTHDVFSTVVRITF
jgi:hypothetical protein